MNGLYKVWIWKMAWRDARRGIKPLLLAMSCVVLGVMAVVIGFSFRDNVQSGIRAQSKTLLGADLSLESPAPFSPDGEALIRSLGADQSRQIAFSAMALFEASGSSRLVQVRAVSGDFPYYGKLETDPPSAAYDFRAGPFALVDENLMLQIGAAAGQRVTIGDQEFQIAGSLRRIPGEPLAFSLLSPRVYVPAAHLDETLLLQRGSRVRYRVYFKFDPDVEVDSIVERISPDLRRLRLRADTVSRRTEAISTSIENLSRYLRLAVFIAVLLAGVGVASGIHVYAKQKIPSAAVLRCVGATARETVLVYLAQIVLVALAGCLLGAVLGALLQFLLPAALKDFLPVLASVSFAPTGILAGMMIGLGTALLFSLIPLLPLRKVSPLLALRSAHETVHARRDPLLWVIALIIIGAVGGVAVSTTGSWFIGVCFTGGIFMVFGFIGLVARGIVALLRRLTPDGLPFPWRQGLASLHRPSNQTTAVMLAIGLGAFLMVTLYNVQSMLLHQVRERAGGGEPDLVFFDVQRDQREPIKQLVESFGVRLHDDVPIVTMRLTGIKHKALDEVRAEPAFRIPEWALRREYRSTYRSRLGARERIVSGSWEGRIDSGSEVIPISLEKSIAETLQLQLGDALQFDLQGVPLSTRVASIREVDWQRLEPNFFVVFPEGVLEQAPQFFALVARTDSNRASASVQRAVIERFPNVSAVDLTLVVNTLEAILNRVAEAVRFIALLIIVTGIAVLASAIVSSRAQRLKESILLRTLGASRSQIVGAIIAEYFLLAVIACVTGSLFALLASWALSFYFFASVAAPSPGPIAAIVVAATTATLVAGVMGCWGIFRRPALEALRAES